MIILWEDKSILSALLLNGHGPSFVESSCGILLIPYFAMSHKGRRGLSIQCLFFSSKGKRESGESFETELLLANIGAGFSFQQ
jgi:hypothetical protein